MSPKILTEQDKAMQREKLLAKGRELFAVHGVHKTSIEDITNAANMAKGSFYQHFKSKEALFFELIVRFHRELFENAGTALAQPGCMPLKERVREYIRLCFKSPEYLSIFKYHEEIDELIFSMQKDSQEEVDALMEMEHAAYEKLLQMYGIDTRQIKPGVIHNYLHAMYFGIANTSLMERDCMDDTFEALLNGLIVYVFGGAS